MHATSLCNASKQCYAYSNAMQAASKQCYAMQFAMQVKLGTYLPCKLATDLAKASHMPRTSHIVSTPHPFSIN
jgi:hypothetical protein